MTAGDLSCKCDDHQQTAKVGHQREREILQLLVEGRSNKDIATLLNLSLYTIETHRRNLQTKLNLQQPPRIDSLRSAQRIDVDTAETQRGRRKFFESLR